MGNVVFQPERAGRSAEENRNLLKWGHPLRTPEGREIRVPNIFKELKRLGLIFRDRKSGVYQLRPAIDRFMEPQYYSLMDAGKHGNIQRILGPELDGAAWVKCECRECHRAQEQSDKTQLPWSITNRGLQTSARR